MQYFEPANVNILDFGLVVQHAKIPRDSMSDIKLHPKNLAWQEKGNGPGKIGSFTSVVFLSSLGQTGCRAGRRLVYRKYKALTFRSISRFGIINKGDCDQSKPSQLSLTLFMSRITANDVYLSLAPNHFTIFANSLDAGADLHRSIQLMKNTDFWKASQYRASIVNKSSAKKLRFGIIFPA